MMCSSSGSHELKNGVQTIDEGQVLEEYHVMSHGCDSLLFRRARCSSGQEAAGRGLCLRTGWSINLQPLLIMVREESWR